MYPARHVTVTVDPNSDSNSGDWSVWAMVAVHVRTEKVVKQIVY